MKEPEAIPLKVRGRKRRGFDERLWIVAPKLLQFGSRTTFARRPGSRLRRALLKRSTELSYEAQNRGDWDYTLLLYADDCKLFNLPIEGGGERVAVVQEEYFGRDGARQLLADWTEPWDEIMFEPELLFDLGDDRILVLSNLITKVRGGPALREPISQLIEFRDGLVVRHCNWLGSWRDGLRAAGLPDDMQGVEADQIEVGAGR
jgi:ketosteroid isomerase-like protein